jgi:ferredoxin
MIRIREIIDPDLRRRIVDALADRRGCSATSIPDWFELDDADYVDLLNDLKDSEGTGELDDDPRM